MTGALNPLASAGGWLAVGGAERALHALRLSDSAVGLTLLALATDAELFALAWAAMRRSAIPSTRRKGTGTAAAHQSQGRRVTWRGDGQSGRPDARWSG